MADVTAKNHLSSLKRATKNHTNYQYNVAQNNEIAAVCHMSECCIDLYLSFQYIKLDLPKIECLSTGAYKKPIAPVEVTRDLVRFLLLCDEYEFPHQRILTQTIFALLLLTFGGPRSGELIESDGWKDSNEGLLYGDVIVIKKSRR